MNKNIVCIHGGSFNGYDPYWKSTGIDYEYLNDISKINIGEGLHYTEQDCRDIFRFQGQVSKSHYWNSYGNRNIIWFYAHLRMIYYYHKNPQYDYYWFYDDDVTIDNWKVFEKSFIGNTTDFISYYLFKKEDYKSQPKIPIIDNNTTSDHMWFERFPGDGDKLPSDVQEYYGSFFPIVRISNRALCKLYELWRNKKLYGYSEGFVPTILNYYNYSLDTIFDNNSESKHFDDKIVNVKHKNIKIGWQWI
jgi:hypothetical protein